MASSQRKRSIARGKSKSDFFVWTDCEVELLLIVTNEYKISKSVESVDWESCHTKYSDILDLYKQQYPSTEESEPVEDDYPHKVEEITKPILTTKLKAIRHKYRQALESGNRRAHGRVLLLYFDLCEQIWGTSPATTTIPDDVKTCDMKDRLSRDCSDYLGPASTLHSGSVDQAGGGILSRVVRSSYGRERIKRKRINDGQLVVLAQEGLKIKKQILEQIEATNKVLTDNMTRLTSSIEKLANAVAEGFSMMRQMMVHPPYFSPPPYSYGHTEPRMAAQTSTQVAQRNGEHCSSTQSLFSDKKGQ